MKLAYSVLSVVLSIAVPFALIGCGKKTDAKTNGKTDKKTGSNHDEKHSHPSKGPHGGHLIKLRDEEYHVEFLHDEKNDTVTIYILDSSAKKQVPIDAKDVVINLKFDGKPKSFSLPAVPDKDDPQGKSSRFQLKDKTLAQGLDAKGAEPKLSLKINGTPYTKEIKHDHEHG